MVKATLLEETCRLMRETDLSYQEIADGSGLGKSWIAKFAQGAIDEPGVSKVQRVYDFLARHATSRFAGA